MPDDVEALFRWFGLKGIPYQDFSEAREAFRAEQSQRSGRTSSERAMEPTRRLHPAERHSDGTNEPPLNALQSQAAEPSEREPSQEFLPQGGSKICPTLPEDATPSAQLANPGSGSSVHGTEAKIRDRSAAAETVVPAWFGPYEHTAQPRGTNARAVETLKQVRERMASRWFALRGVLDTSAPSRQPMDDPRELEIPPVLAFFSWCGGVGKTSLAASVTRALAAQGERLLLLDATRHEVLPFFFGAQSLRREPSRVFAPPPGTADHPIHLLTSGDLAGGPSQAGGTPEAKLRHVVAGYSRVVLDVPTGDTTLLQAVHEIAQVHILVPLLPDITSMVGLRALRTSLAGNFEGAASEPQLWFLLTRFDATRPLHLDMREVLEQELGDRLLPFVIRESAAIPEALAQGMTVVDYVPTESVAKDVQQLAAWVRTLMKPALAGLGQARWSEQ